MIASLPMYDWPHRRRANDALWAYLGDVLRHNGIKAPQSLTRPADLHDHWREPTLMLSQTCAMPYRQGLWRVADILGTLDYGLPGCAAGQYYSVIIASLDDARTDISQYAGATPAINAPNSQSGCAALMDAAAQLGVNLADPIITGAHAATIQAVASGQAALAAVDAVSWGLACEVMPEVRMLKVLGHTRPSAALPFICAKGQNVARLQAALEAAFDSLPPELADQFGSLRFLRRTDNDYRRDPWEDKIAEG